MATFLIQVSGDESSHHETKANYWWEEPIKENIYINHGWKKRKESVEAWQKVKQNDRVIIYCTGSVEPYPSQISHTGEVLNIKITGDKAKMVLKIKSLITGIPLSIINEEIESGKLTEKMARCGTQGFNIAVVEDRDFDRIMELSTKFEYANQFVRAEEETEIQKLLELNVNVIEKGLQLIDKNVVLPPNAGIPDLVCKDKNGNFVAIELKAGEAGYDALGQVISYKGAIKRKTGKKVRAIVIGHSLDQKILFAKELRNSDGLPLVEFKRYSLKAETFDVN